MKNEFALAFNEVLEEKGLPKEIILEALGQALVSAYRKSVLASTAQDIKARINLEKGEFSILVEKEVVEAVENDLTEVELEKAREIDPAAQLGDLVMVDSTPADFGRVAAQQARQVIQQKIREAENKEQIEHYEKQLGDIISGVVQATNATGLTIALEKNAEGFMPRKEMISKEHFRLHERVRAVVAEIRETGRGPQIILSRTHRDFLRRLLENEVPEIFHGVVEIRSISREPGQRAKVAVSATQQGIDPVGACVGMRGVRIQAIVRELHDEKIDVIEWNSDPTVFISKAISPARVNGVYLRESIDGQRNALVVVPEDQLSLAIGRDGQNARLAAKLTGWRIDIKSLTESVSDWLFNLQNKVEFKEIAAEENEAVAAIEELLARKAEGRILSAEENELMAAFNDRLEKRSVRKNREKYESDQKIHKDTFDSIPKAAFEMGIDGTGLPLDLQDALCEAGFETAGKLILAYKLNPDSLRAVNGVTDKTMARILEFIEELPNLLPEVEEEQPAEQLVEIEKPETEAIESPVELPVAVEEQQVVAETEQQPESVVPVKETEEKELSFDEIFSLKPEVFEPVSDEVEEEEGETTGELPSKKKKKGKKASKFRELVYDPDKDVTIVKKKHKRGDAGWDEA